MRRYSVSVSVEVWGKGEPLFPRQGNRADNRLFFDAATRMAKSGAPWRDLPERFGKWNSVYARVQPSRQSRVMAAHLRSQCRRPRPRRTAHRLISGAGASAGGKRLKKIKAEAAIGRSRGGLTSKIHLATDGHGRARRIIVGTGQEHDSRQALALLEGLRPPVVVADRAYTTTTHCWVF